MSQYVLFYYVRDRQLDYVLCLWIYLLQLLLLQAVEGGLEGLGLVQVSSSRLLPLLDLSVALINF